MRGTVVSERSVRIVGRRRVRLLLVERSGERRLVIGISWGISTHEIAPSITVPAALIGKLIRALQAIQAAAKVRGT